MGRILDQGTYTIYIVEEARSRPDLDDSVYSTQAVTFGQPVETVTVTVTESTGTLTVDSSPGMSVVTLDNGTAGITPVRISGIPPGAPYPCRFSRRIFAVHDGLCDLGRESREISAVLQPLTATPSNTPTGGPATTTPQGRLATPTLVPLGALALAVLGFRYRS